MVEGGAAVAGEFHRRGLVDRYVLYLAPALAWEATTAPLCSAVREQLPWPTSGGVGSTRSPPRRRPARRTDGPPAPRRRLTCSPASSKSSAVGGRARGVPGLRIAATRWSSDASMGASIAVNGCCLTVVAFDARTARVVGGRRHRRDLRPHLPRRTRAGDPVNLERPVRLADRLGGHLVQGHVDAVGRIVRPSPDLAGPHRPQLCRYVVEKGSVTVDGVSLTVVDVLPDGFTVALIPHTADGHDPGAQGPGRSGQPRGGRDGQVRRAAARTHRGHAETPDHRDAMAIASKRPAATQRGLLAPIPKSSGGHRPRRDRGGRRRRGPRERGRPHHGRRVRPPPRRSPSSSGTPPG